MSIAQPQLPRSLASTLLERLAIACLMLSMAFLALMSALVVLQVICRNGFDLGLPWADELARFCGVSLVYLAVPLLGLRGDLIAVDMLVKALGGRMRQALCVLNELAVLGFCAVTLYGFQAFLARAAKFSTAAMSMPNWIFYAPALVGVALLAVVSILRLVILVSGTAPSAAIGEAS
jgi:TRAP-type C4-dicarboxylate transport system permease small subunit